jgi:AAA+ superfamily predicted ATPase
MRRNGFVTVFLRLLEYHEGILFLTTNRIEEFDPAFASRIHLKLEYDDLSPEKRANIWRNLLEQVESCRNWDQSVYKQLGKELVLNGRDIKNLIRTSVAIAKHDKEELGIDVIKGLYELNFQRGGLIGGKESGLGIFEGNASKSGKSLLG